MDNVFMSSIPFICLMSQLPICMAEKVCGSW